MGNVPEISWMCRNFKHLTWKTRFIIFKWECLGRISLLGADCRQLVFGDSWSAMEFVVGVGGGHSCLQLSVCLMWLQIPPMMVHIKVNSTTYRQLYSYNYRLRSLHVLSDLCSYVCIYLPCPGGSVQWWLIDLNCVPVLFKSIYYSS